MFSDWLAGLGVTRVVMEATSDNWKPPFYLSENTFQTWLVNAADVNHLPGRPKRIGSRLSGLCKVAERQMLRASFVPPAVQGAVATRDFRITTAPLLRAGLSGRGWRGGLQWSSVPTVPVSSRGWW